MEGRPPVWSCKGWVSSLGSRYQLWCPQVEYSASDPVSIQLQLLTTALWNLCSRWALPVKSPWCGDKQGCFWLGPRLEHRECAQPNRACFILHGVGWRESSFHSGRSVEGPSRKGCHASPLIPHPVGLCVSSPHLRDALSWWQSSFWVEKDLRERAPCTRSEHSSWAWPPTSKSRLHP